MEAPPGAALLLGLGFGFQTGHVHAGQQKFQDKSQLSWPRLQGTSPHALSTSERRAGEGGKRRRTAEVKANVDVKKHMLFFERSA